MAETDDNRAQSMSNSTSDAPERWSWERDRMEKHPNGFWVQASDYDSLQSQLTAARAENVNHVDQLNRLIRERNELANELALTPDQRVHQQSDGELRALVEKVARRNCERVDSDEGNVCAFYERELRDYCPPCHAKELRARARAPVITRITEIVQGWASADPDAIDDLDALCRIAEVLDVEVEARTRFQ